MNNMQPIIQLAWTHSKATSQRDTGYFTSPEDKAETVLGSCKNIVLKGSNTKYTHKHTHIHISVLVHDHCKI
jgi:hypothetical protein